MLLMKFFIAYPYAILLANEALLLKALIDGCDMLATGACLLKAAVFEACEEPVTPKVKSC
jgi:hypothetical protein